MTSAERLNELVEQCLSRMDREGPAAVDAVCSEQPDYAPALRERLDRLQQFGLFEAKDGEAETPEQIGDFRIQRRLGDGGMGVVYLAEQQSLGRPVALKLVRPELLYFGKAHERFRREVEAVAQLQHPGIVQVHAVGEADGVPYFAMEYVEGVDLGSACERFAGRNPAELTGRDLYELITGHPLADSAVLPELFRGHWIQMCLRVGKAVADALAHSHSRGILHRDVKASNIMVTAAGRVVLLDFGLAVREGAGNLTQTRALLGSLPYMAPEQLRGGSGDASHRSDLYSLGITLFELLTLTPPFAGDKVEELRHLILAGASTRPRQLNSALPWDVETVVATAMEVDAERRYPSAEAFAQDLTNLLELRPIQARPPGLALRGRRWIQRHPALSVALVLGGVALLAGPIAYIVAQSRAQGRIERALTTARVEKEQAEERFRQVTRLSDAQILRNLEAEAEQLWPAYPRLLPELDGWLERATGLTDHLPAHRAFLAELRIAGTADAAAAEGYRYASAEEQWWHDNLSRLVRQLDGFLAGDGLLAAVRERRSQAGTLAARSVEGFADEWEDALFEISESAAYAGLEIEPQMGLVPLGVDPDSGRWEFWHVPTGERPERDPATGRWRIEAGTGVVLILLPGDTLWIGSQNTEPDQPNYDRVAESLQYVEQVTVGPLFISKYELTQAQWQRIMGENPSHYGPEDPRVAGTSWVNPVESVSFPDCVEALRRVGLVLPAEPQWEYAARGGTTTPWWTGDSTRDVQGLANVADTSFLELLSALATESWNDGFAAHAPVGQFEPNPFGLHDTAGNISEWCLPHQPTPPHEGLLPVRRGGSFANPAFASHVATRHFDTAGFRNLDTGLRPARRVDG